jgi:hypothetical protein
MFTNKKSLLALSVASAIALSGCGSDNDNNQPDEPVTPPPVTVVVAPEAPAELGSVVNGNVINSASFDVVDAKVSFFENGVASTNVVDVDGNVTSSVDSEDGNFTFQIKDGASVSQLTVVVVAEGFVSKSFVVDLAGLSEDTIEVQLGLTSLTTEGVATVSKDSAISGGSSADAITASIAGDKASVVIPGGTTLQDADGNIVTGGSVNLAVTTGDTSTSAGAAITPEGLDSGDVSTVLTPVSVASVNMVDDNGVKIKKFSQPINVNMALPANKGFTTGDELSLSSQNEDTGVWTVETQKVTVGALSTTDSSFYNASFMTDHLTFFAATQEEARCTEGVRLLFSGDSVPAGGLYANLSSSDAAGTFFVKPNADSAGATYNPRVSADATAELTITDREGNAWFASNGEIALCGDVDVALASPVSYVNETLTLSAQCSNDTTQTVAGSGALVKYSRTGKAKKRAEGENGTYALTGLIEGENYTVTVKYKEALKSLGTVNYTIEANGEAKTQSESIVCDTTTGGTGGS